jgi:hypothetical protein
MANSSRISARASSAAACKLIAVPCSVPIADRINERGGDKRLYGEALGLIGTGRVSVGRAYHRTWDEKDHNSGILRAADCACIDLMRSRLRPSRRSTGSKWMSGHIVRVDHGLFSGPDIERVRNLFCDALGVAIRMPECAAACNDIFADFLTR